MEQREPYPERHQRREVEPPARVAIPEDRALDPIRIDDVVRNRQASNEDLGNEAENQQREAGGRQGPSSSRTQRGDTGQRNLSGRGAVWIASVRSQGGSRAGLFYPLTDGRKTSSQRGAESSGKDWRKSVRESAHRSWARWDDPAGDARPPAVASHAARSRRSACPHRIGMSLVGRQPVCFELTASRG